MSLVDDHVMPPDSAKGVGFLDHVFVRRQQHLEVDAFDLICQGLSTLFVSLQNQDLDARCP